MRMHNICLHIPGAKLFWDRVTLSRVTTFYFVFSLLHFIVQVIFQIQAFSINAQAATFLYSLVTEGNASAPGFLVLGSDLRMCDTVPSTLSTASCMIVWNGNTSESMTVNLDNGSVSGNSSSTVSTASSSTISSSSSSTSMSSSSSASRSSSSRSATSSSVLANQTYPPAMDVANNVVTVTQTVTVTATPSPPASVDSDKDQMQKRHIERRSSQISVPVQVDGEAGVQVSGLPDMGPVTLDHACLNVLNWPVEQLDNTKREDVAFILFQFWLLAMSLVALLNESIPHIVASLLTHILATAWGGFQIWSTADFREDFNGLTSTGACGVDLLPNYWSERSNAEIPSLVFNAVALLASAVLSWRLMKCFGWQTFKRVGASRSINRMYTVVLLLSISIQLTLFFIAVTAGIWIDQLYNGAVGHLATNSTLFKVIMAVVLVLLIPWLTIGWISVRREYRILMLLFLITSIIYAGGWASLFTSPTFRWTFIQWRFFSLISSAAVLLTLITFVLGIICRMSFGKGLARYLSNDADPDEKLASLREQTLDWDSEKAAFPSTDAPLPTFSATFGRRADAPPSQMFAARELGPRFFNPYAAPFDLQPVALPARSPSTRSASSSHSKTSETNAAQSKRWVIE